MKDWWRIALVVLILLLFDPGPDERGTPHEPKDTP